MKIKALYLFTCSPAELFAVFISALFLLRAQLELHLSSSETIIKKLQNPCRISTSPLLAPMTKLRTTRVVSLIEAVDRNLGWKPSCLRRAIALSAISRNTGHNPGFKIGVHRQGNELLAHCWLELNGLRLEMRDPGFSCVPLA